MLANSYENSLKIAVINNLKTTSFPSISTCAFYYPKNEAAKVSSKAIKDFLEDEQQIRQINLVFFSESDAKTFLKHQVF